MSKYAIQAAIDSLQQTDAAGFSNWAQHRREALAKLHRAHDDYEYELSLAQSKGLVKACALFAATNAIAVGLLARYLGWV
jgi:hypothetical protein